MTMLPQRAVVAAKEETTEGTAETLAAADGFLAFNPKFTPGIEMNERDPVRPSLSPMKSLPGSRSAQISFDVELVGVLGSPGVAPFWGKLMKACGFSETIVASTSVTYEPASESIPSMTLGYWMDGKKHLLWGARGNVVLKLESGKPGMLSFEFSGADWSEVDEALLAGVTYESTLPPIFMDAGFQIDSWSAIINLLEINANNNIALRKDANSASGNISAAITNRKPSLRFDPENVLVATFDFLGKWRSGSLPSMVSSFGSSSGNAFAVNAPKVQFINISQDEREEISVLGIEGLLVMDSGDDELSIVIT